MSHLLNQNLSNLNKNEPQSIDQAFNKLYPEIKKIAHAQLNQLQPGKTITATVLVNECYLKLQKNLKIKLSNQKQFYALIAKCMKQFLIDELRGKNRQKRNAELKTALVSQIIDEKKVDVRLNEVIEAIEQLEIINPDLAELVNLHCFGGFTFDELSTTLDKSKRQLIRKWQVAKSMIVTLLNEI